MKLYCPKKGSHGGTCDVLICLFSCPTEIKVKCEEYGRYWPEIQALEVPEKYIEKYGQPDKAEPICFRKRAPRGPVDG